MIDPNGRVVMISGASRGIGFAIARKLHDLGYTVSLGVREPARFVLRTTDWDPLRLLTCRYVAEDWKTHRQWVDDVTERFGHIDGLINNAGRWSPMTLAAPDEAELDLTYAVNVKAPLNLIALCLPWLEKSGTGRIINIASLSGKRVKNDRVAYAISKFGVMALTHATRRAGWDKGVRATAICPGFVATDMTAGTTAVSAAEMTQPGDVADIAAMILQLPNTASIAEVLVNCRLEDSL